MRKFINIIDLFEDRLSIPDETIQTEYKIKKYKRAEQYKKETKILYDSDQFLVVIPLTHLSSIYYSRMAKGVWCTASLNSFMFDRQNSLGPIIIIIQKTTGLAWQYWPPNGQFIDRKHFRVNITYFLQDYPELKPILEPHLRPE